jgi:hypothetical protein
MKSSAVVKLHAYNNRMLSRPEILLCKFNEKRNAEQKRLADEKMLEKLVLSRISSKLVTVPVVRFNLIFTKANYFNIIK